MKRPRRWAGIVAAIAVVIGAFAPSAAVALPDPAPADVTALATLDKTTSATTVAPGETFTYTLTIGCSAITDLGCRGAVLTDDVPAPFVVQNVSIGGGINTAEPPVVTGNSVTVTWNTPLGDGTVGLLDSTDGVVTIQALLPADASYDVSGITVTNDAVIEGTNFVDAYGQVDVTPIVPLDLATNADKTLSPAQAIGTAGTPVVATLSGGNDSNATVETLTIEDPAPGTTPNPFDSLAFTGFGTVTPPTGTTQTDYYVFVGGAWVEAPGGVVPAPWTNDDVQGTRVVFTGAIPPGATASVVVNTQLTDAGAALPDGTGVVNTVQSTVGLGGETETADADATFIVRQNDVTVSGEKSFTPDTVIAGDSSIVTITGTNTSTIPIQVLEVREPSTGSFPDAYEFTGFVGPVAWPDDATTGQVVYTFEDGETETVPFASNTTPGDPTLQPIDQVASFELQFTGTILPGSEVTADFGVETDPDLTGLPATVPNEIGIHGSNESVDGNATASGDLYIYAEQIETYVSKQIRPDEILAVPGQVTTVSLDGGLLDRPVPPDPSGSTGRADVVIVQDPADPVEPDAWWNAFNLTAITQTPVPGDASLTIEYWDTTTDQWVTLAGPIDGPTIYSQQVPSDVSDVAGGVRFVYTYTGDDGGFAPGTDFAPNFTASLRPDGRYDPIDLSTPFSVPNCAQTDATSPNPDVDPATSSIPPAECPEIDVVPPDPGNADIIDKTFGTSSSGGVKSVIARSGDTIPSVLRWSTGGYSGIESMTITDIAAPETTAIADSVYDAFDLVRVQPITSTTDPLIVFDAVESVKLYDGSGWVTATNDPCAALCIGGFPGMTLTTAEQSTTTAVRLVFIESPDRAAASAGIVDAPPVGSGVARSTGNERPITLTWQVRDERRGDGTPVLGDELYNLTTDGLVRNTVQATGVFENGDPDISATDQDDVLIVDVPLTTTTSKSWSGGPLAVPGDFGVPPSQFPLSRVAVTTINTTPARVDTLQITDPAPGSVTDRTEDPFQAFTLNNFSRVDMPAGATSAVVTLFCPDGSSTGYSPTQALALTPALMPCDVSGIQVVYEGRIAANAAGTIEFDLRLRPFWRGTTERVSVADSPIANTAEGVIADVDPAGTCPPPQTGARYACDDASSSIALTEPTFSVSAGKTVVPSQQKEDDFSPVTMTLSAQPGGSAHTQTLTMTDDDPTFWNAFDFSSPDPLWQLPPPVARVQVCYLDGGTFTPATVAAGAAAVGGTWTCMPRLGDLSVTAAISFMEAMPATVHGLSFQFWAATDIGWLSPANPVINVPFDIVRRTDLRSGGPVPTTRSDQPVAPGETTPGSFDNTLEVESTSVLVGPGQQLTADAQADAEYRHLHLQAEISVSKTPGGDVEPGAVIPFELEYTNTGERALTEVVFTDELPLDGADEPMLVFDPDRDPTVPPWSFALAGAAPTPPSGDPLPTDPDEVTVDTSDPTRIVFTMPAGTVLEVGQTYTITLQMMIRPGTPAGTPLTNTATMSVAEPLDDCVTTYDPDNDWCLDTTTVTPLSVPALATAKSVRADAPVNETGIPTVRSDINGYSCDGTADSDGFYRFPCVVTTLPGDTEQWRFTVLNVGTLPLDSVVAVDRLPAAGDAGVIVQVPRGSTWAPTFAGDVALEPTASTPAGATLTTYYSTATLPCTADLNPLGTQCASGAWTVLPSTPDDALLASVRSLKFVVDFPDALFAPADSLDITFRTRTTPTTLVDVSYPPAYNTVAVGGAAVAGAERVTVPGTEGRRVGVSYPTGPVGLLKTLSGEATEFAPDSFEVQLTCTVDGEPVTGLPSIELVPGIPEEITGLPWGAECTATEGANGQTETNIGTATVGGPDGPVEFVDVENVFDPASLIIRKVVDTAAVDQRGNPIEYGPFTFTVTCTDFGGETIYADGYNAENPMTESISPGQVWALGGLPGTGECIVTETDDLDAASTTMSATPGTSVEGTQITVDLVADAAVDVVAENTFTTGSLELEKLVEGEAAALAQGPFALVVDCRLDTGDGPAIVWLGRVLLGGDEPWTATIDDIATGATCTVTEPFPSGATTVDITPSSVTIGDGTTVEVTVTNTFDASSLTVAKVVDGEGAPLYGTGPFEVTLECLLPLGGVVDIPGGASRLLSEDNGFTTTYDPLPVGALCTIDETDAGGATSTTITDSAGEPVTGLFRVTDQALAFTVTNTFDLGSMIVSKVVSGTEASAHVDDDFEIVALCELDGDIVAIPGGAQRTLTTTTAVEYTDLPVGAECSVRESDDGGASAVTMTPADPGDPTQALVTIGADAAASVVIENRFDPEMPPTGADLAQAATLGALGVLLLGGGGALLAVRRRPVR
ncbi:DUF5979 domain-containing protein [Microbacterium koreense]|uniref:DUF5979 domain-containing protein n=1 Tax=Microbacterium koreense TaxID=323761 RepID=A0ABW2ZNN6_9MICO